MQVGLKPVAKANGLDSEAVRTGRQTWITGSVGVERSRGGKKWANQLRSDMLKQAARHANWPEFIAFFKNENLTQWVDKNPLIVFY